jgi:beta-phosphoglucomutase-like phosphatase (HAD superfamily)
MRSLKLPVGSFKAYLFDCDGTIADSMPLHYVAWSKALAQWNCEFSEDLFYAWGGMPVAKIITTLNEKRGLNLRTWPDAKKGSIWKFFLSLGPFLKCWNMLKPAMA